MEQDFILTPEDNPGMNSLAHLRKYGKLVNCQFFNLRTLLSTEIISHSKVCKLDVEGQEMLILKSLQPIFHLFHQCVFIIEISPRLLPLIGFTYQHIYDFFNELGFKYQFGNPDKLDQWDDFFYHPDYNVPLSYSNAL